MAQTTTTTLDAWVPSELISADILQETRPNIVVAGLVQRELLGAGQGKVWEQTQLPTTAAASVAEGADLAAAARTPATTASITIGEVGLSTEVTDLASAHLQRGAVGEVDPGESPRGAWANGPLPRVPMPGRARQNVSLRQAGRERSAAMPNSFSPSQAAPGRWSRRLPSQGALLACQA